MARVVVIGSVNVDHVVEADRFPAPGETLTGRRARTGLGGKGANQAVASALAGASTAMIARVGTDAAGQRARDGLSGRGVDVAGVLEVPGAETGTAWITVAAGDNTIIVIAGANHAWPPDGDPLGGAGTPGAVVLAQLEVPLEVLRRAARHCRGRFLLNAAPAAELPDELLARCDVLIVNEHEQAVVAGGPAGAGRTDTELSNPVSAGTDPAGADPAGADLADTDPAGAHPDPAGADLAGVDPAAPAGPADAGNPPDPDAVRRAHAALRTRGARAVVTTLGAEGAMVTDADGVTEAIPALPASVVDTTGAGDAFAGVLAARLALGDSLIEAARWGAAAGSLAVRAPGAQESYPDAPTLRAAVGVTTG
jgi:ribokinase